MRQITTDGKHGCLVSEPELHALYEIELCSGEHRCWEYLGKDSRSLTWWRDVETGLEFNEGSLMYVWWVVGKQDGPAAVS